MKAINEHSANNMKLPSSNVVEGAFWMFGIMVVLFFVPGINGLIAGLVGGYKVGTVGRALVAAILPAIAAGLAIWGLLAIFDWGFIGFFAGIATGLLFALSELGLFVGAALGAAISNRGDTINTPAPKW